MSANDALAQHLSQVREALDDALVVFEDTQWARAYRNEAPAALSAIEQHVQDMDSKLRRGESQVTKSREEMDDTAKWNRSPADDALDRLTETRRSIAASLIAVKGHLDTPYPDDPRWTPWTRFIERELQRLGESKDDIATVRSALEQLREERDAKGRELWGDRGVMLDLQKRAEAAEAALAAEKRDRAFWAASNSRERQAAEAEVRRLAEGLRDLLYNGGWGHSHWDHTGQHGAGCSTCIQQREAKERARALLAASPRPGDTEGGQA